MEKSINNPIGEKEFVETLIPQRHPFVMVDTLYSYSETNLVAGYTVQKDAFFLENNCFVESGIIEHMAQAVALHTGYSFFLRNEIAPTGYIGSIKKIEIKELPKLHDKIKTSIHIVQEFAGITLVDVVCKRNDIEIAKGQMKTVLAK
jgi:predicted hotdog family 3-hydroxylacyl-ACP dehydratase